MTPIITELTMAIIASVLSVKENCNTDSKSYEPLQEVLRKPTLTSTVCTLVPSTKFGKTVSKVPLVFPEYRMTNYSNLRWWVPPDSKPPRVTKVYLFT